MWLDGAVITNEKRVTDFMYSNYSISHAAVTLSEMWNHKRKDLQSIFYYMWQILKLLIFNIYTFMNVCIHANSLKGSYNSSVLRVCFSEEWVLTGPIRYT